MASMMTTTVDEYQLNVGGGRLHVVSKGELDSGGCYEEEGLYVYEKCFGLRHSLKQCLVLLQNEIQCCGCTCSVFAPSSQLESSLFFISDGIFLDDKGSLTDYILKGKLKVLRYTCLLEISFSLHLSQLFPFVILVT